MSLEKHYKNFNSFINNCINSFISILKTLLFSKFSLQLPQATAETCIILGNGPSLSESLRLHTDSLKKHPLICVNSFSITEQYEKLQPVFYVLLDPGFWSGNNELVTQTLESLQRKTVWELHLLVPPISKKSALFQQLISKNKNIKPIYFNYVVFKGFSRIAHFFYKKNLAMPQSQNVLVAAIFLGINIGFKNIYIVGADHTWHQQLHVDDKNVLCIKHVHFYEQEEKIKYTPFYKGVHIQETFRMHEILTTMGKAFYGYMVLNKYAKSRDCNIYNASEVSFIDAFERKHL